MPNEVFYEPSFQHERLYKAFIRVDHGLTGRCVHVMVPSYFDVLIHEVITDPNGICMGHKEAWEKPSAKEYVCLIWIIYNTTK